MPKRCCRRSGAVLPMTVLCLVALLGMVALAVDLSLLALARTQAQNAADAASMAAARALDGDSSTNNNIATALATGATTAADNVILNQPVAASQVDVQVGVLQPTSSPPYFVAANMTATAGPPPMGTNYGLGQVTITGSMTTNFAAVLGISTLPYTATSQSVHRPRDVAILLDYSGSMAFDSYLAAPPSGNYPGASWGAYTWNNPAPPTTSINVDPLVPNFGHYDPNTASTTLASLVGDGTNFLLPTNEILKPGNVTTPSSSGAALMGDFLTQNAAGVMISAFTAASSPTPVTAVDGDNFPTAINGATGSNPGGVRPLKVNQNAGPGYAKNVLEYLNLAATPVSNATSKNATFEGVNGSTDTAYGASFAGYTYGPAYWGMTFFVWPPYPDPTSNPLVASTTVNDNTTSGPGGGPVRDWRQRFYWMTNTANQKKRLDDDNVLWNPDGTMKPPGSTTIISGSPVAAHNGSWTVQINYEAVLAWIKNGGPAGVSFPQNLRSGRILYYTSIPSTVTNATTDYDQLFWKRYIDYVFGNVATGTTGSPPHATLLSGFGTDFSWSTASAPSQINPRPADITKNPPASPAYLDYRDNPMRPKLRWWFGPMTLADFLWDDYDPYTLRYWRPGTCHEAPMWVLKAGVQSALQDIQKNHPNDWVTTIYFCVPQDSANAGFGQRFNRARAPLGKQYTLLTNSLWYPPCVLDTSTGEPVSLTSTSPPGEIRPWDLNFNPTSSYNETPMATGGTTPSMAFMTAYNQFSSNPSLVNFATSNGLTSALPGDAGGNGRLGARKMVIFETDGVPNVGAYANFVNNGANQSYYEIRQPTEFPTLNWCGNMGQPAIDSTYDAVKALCNYPTANRPGYNPSTGPSLPGYSQQGKPVLVHALAFGGMMESTSPLKPQCLAFLQQVQVYGSTQQYATDPLPSWKIVVGTSAQRISTIQTAFTTIMQDGVQVSLFN